VCPCRHQGLSNRTQVQDIRMGTRKKSSVRRAKAYMCIHTQRIQHVRVDRRSLRDGVIVMKTKMAERLTKVERR